jgi:hypothetical protein
VGHFPGTWAALLPRPLSSAPGSVHEPRPPYQHNSEQRGRNVQDAMQQRAKTAAPPPDRGRLLHHSQVHGRGAAVPVGRRRRGGVPLPRRRHRRGGDGEHLLRQGDLQVGRALGWRGPRRRSRRSQRRPWGGWRGPRDG